MKTYTTRKACRVCDGSGKFQGWHCGCCHGIGSYLVLMYGEQPKTQRDLFNEGGSST
jgi:hypothetical protein